MNAYGESLSLPLGEAVIRDLCKDDAPAIAKYMNNRNIWLRVRDRLPHPYALSDAEKWLEKVLGAPATTHWAIANDEECIGCIGIELLGDTYRGTAEIGYWLAEPFWGRGLASAALKTMTPYLMKRFNLRRMHGEVHANHPASCRVLEKAGYTREAVHRKAIIKDGEVLDSIIYVMLDDEV